MKPLLCKKRKYSLGKRLKINEKLEMEVLSKLCVQKNSEHISVKQSSGFVEGLDQL